MKKRFFLVLVLGLCGGAASCLTRAWMLSNQQLVNSFVGEWEFVVLTLSQPGSQDVSFDDDIGDKGKITVNPDHTFNGSLNLGVPHGSEAKISGTWYLNEEPRDTVMVTYMSDDPLLNDLNSLTPKSVTAVLHYEMKDDGSGGVRYLYLEHSPLFWVPDEHKKTFHSDELEAYNKSKAIFVFKRKVSGK